MADPNRNNDNNRKTSSGDDIRTDKTVGGDQGAQRPAPAPDKSQQTDTRPDATPKR